MFPELIEDHLQDPLILHWKYSIESNTKSNKSHLKKTLQLISWHSIENPYQSNGKILRSIFRVNARFRRCNSSLSSLSTHRSVDEDCFLSL